MLQQLSFTLDRAANAAGRLASFGLNRDNDVRLPKIQGQGYRNHHFYFYLVPETGELMLRDLTPRRTEIRLHNAAVEDQKHYGLCGEPRVRVIPRDHSRLFSIVFGTDTNFEFEWRCDVGGAQDSIVRTAARALAVPGMTPTRATSSLVQMRHHELRSRYTPTAPSPRAHNIDVHRYKVLGEGGFGVVSKAVDLRTGQLWAVKEIKLGTQSSPSRATFTKEVDTMFRLRHVSETSLLAWTLG
jgi:hypothetical protein